VSGNRPLQALDDPMVATFGGRRYGDIFARRSREATIMMTCDGQISNIS